MSESKGNTWAKYLDGAIFACLLLTAFAAPVSIAATNVGWILGVVLWIVRTGFKPRPVFFRTPVDFAFVGFFAWSLLSSLLSYAPDLSLDRLRVLTLFPIAYLFAQNIGKSERVRAIVLLLLVSTMTTVFLTFSERITGRGVQILQIKEDGVLARHGIKNGDTIFQVNGEEISEPREILYPLFSSQPAKLQVYRPDYYLDIEIKEPITTEVTVLPQDALGFNRWQSGRNWRSAGFYGHYATYAEVLQLVMSLVFGLLIALPKKKSYFGAMLLICLVSMGGALLLTATRSSQAAFLLSAFCIVALGANRKVFLTLLALSLPLAVAAAIYVQQSRGTGFVDSTDGSTTWRLTVWREGVELLTKSPRHLLVGVGIDSVKRYKCDWGLFANCTLPAGHFHSTPLQIAVETGLPALFLWLFVVWRYGKALFDALMARNNDAEINAENDASLKANKNTQEPVTASPRHRVPASAFERGVLLGAFGGLIGFLASGLFHYNLGDSEVAMVFFLIMGLSLFLIKENRKPAKI